MSVLVTYDATPKSVHSAQAIHWGVNGGRPPVADWTLISAADPSAIPFSCYETPAIRSNDGLRLAKSIVYTCVATLATAQSGIRMVTYNVDTGVRDDNWPIPVFDPARVGFPTPYHPDLAGMAAMTAKWNALWDPNNPNNQRQYGQAWIPLVKGSGTCYWSYIALDYEGA